MADKFSFDVVSQVDMQEALNAVDQTMKEVKQRYDFRGSTTTVTLDKAASEIVMHSEDEMRLKSVVDILDGKLVKRGISLKALTYHPVEDAAGGTAKRRISIQSGIPIEKCKEIVKFLKTAKLKVQASIQEDQVRVSGTKKDVLQEAIAILKEEDFGIFMEFANYR